MTRWHEIHKLSDVKLSKDTFVHIKGQRVQHFNKEVACRVKGQWTTWGSGTRHQTGIPPVESRPRSWLWMRWMLSLAAISLPFSMPALERSEPEDCGCILVAEAYFSNMTDGRPCSVVFGVSSTIPLIRTRGNTVFVFYLRRCRCVEKHWFCIKFG